MSKILRFSVGLAAALLICPSTGAYGRDNRASVWSPTSTTNTTVTQGDAPATLKTLQPEQSRDFKIEHAVPLTESAEQDGLAKALAEGDEFMARGRWYDAKKRFEKGLKTYPDDPTLRSRFAEARRRLEIGIRYQDGSFVALTSAATRDDALAVFDEVFQNIDRYHVDQPSYDELFALGMSGVGEALEEEKFYLRNRIPASQKPIALDTLRLVNERLANERFATVRDVERGVFWAARQLRNRASVPEVAVVSEFLCASVSSLDAYSASLTPTQVDDVFSLIDGKFVGIGVELKTDAPTKVVRVIPTSPAEEAGVRVGDEIVTIDGVQTAGLTGGEIGELLQGREGDVARLTLRDADGSAREVTATRRPIDVPSVENVHFLEGPGAIGYAKITCFQKTTSEELSRALNSLTERGARGLVIDLRQNPGGLLQEAINVSDLFLNSGVIVQTRGRNGYRSFKAKNESPCALPLVLLVDENSASAAEIFAGAMQENGRATIVGTQSYGKGTVQAIVQLNVSTSTKPPIAGLRLTTEKFYSPNGRAYSGVGVFPNVDVEQERDRLARMASTNEQYAESFEGTGELGLGDSNVGYILKPVKNVKVSPNEFETDLCLATGAREVLKKESELKIPTVARDDRKSLQGSRMLSVQK